MQPKALTKTSKKIFNKIIERLNGSDSCRIGEPNRAFMQLSVEKLYTHNAGTEYSFCHYFKQNGDMCQDPEMVFLLHKSGRVYPIMFQQAIPPVYQQSMYMKDGEWKLNPRTQREHAKFANMWFKNRKEQQNI